ncbi:MAG: molybdopterin-guanine dinucleotide biosynthesis protein B [Steroidobacteraceae bacterium]
MRVFGIVGRSDSGKTQLITRLVRLAITRGLRVSTVKHAHHTLDLDAPGKDSWLHREAGAHEVLVASAQRWALLHERRAAPEPPLESLLARLEPCDLVLVEGFKQEVQPRLEVYRKACGQQPLALEDRGLCAVATPDPECFEARPGLQLLPLDEAAVVLDYILRTAAQA